MTARAFGPDGSFDLDSPPLGDHDWDELHLDRQGIAVDNSKDDVFQGWYKMPEFTCLRELAAPHRNPDAAAPPPGDQTPGPQVLPLLGGDRVAIVDRAGAHHSEDDGKDHEKRGDNV